MINLKIIYFLLCCTVELLIILHQLYFKGRDGAPGKPGNPGPSIPGPPGKPGVCENSQCLGGGQKGERGLNGLPGTFYLTNYTSNTTPRSDFCMLSLCWIVFNYFIHQMREACFKSLKHLYTNYFSSLKVYFFIYCYCVQDYQV